MMTKGLLAVILALGSAVAGLSQTAGTIEEGEKGRLQLTLSQSSDHAEVARLELEVDLGDRLWFRADLPVSVWPAEDAEIGLGYDFLREGRSTLGAGIELRPSDPSDLSLRLESRIALGRAEIHSELAVEVGRTRDVMLELAGGRGGSNWRGTLELRYDAGASELRITPGVTRRVRGVWIGMGIALPSASTSKTSLVFRTGFDF